MSSAQTHSAHPHAVRLRPEDNVVIAIDAIPQGGTAAGLTARERILKGHKMAVEPIREGEPIKKFGQIIGFATQHIAPGEWVHEHNVGLHDFARDYAFCADARDDDVLPTDLRATFKGYRRASGRTGTRNYIGILTSVNCSASVARFAAAAVERSGVLADHPGIDGIVPIVHGTGCGHAAYGEGFEVLRRTQWGYASHPNFAAVVMVGLGCEVFQIGRMKKEYGLEETDTFRTLTIQETGGTQKTVEAIAASIRDMIPIAARTKRETRPAAELTLALQCGGSDGYSGLTANPALGAASDLLVRHGGTSILSETPEIYGAEHLLTRRAATPAIGEKLVDRIRWWGLHGPQRRQDEQQPLAGQQSGRPHHYSGKVARRDRQERSGDVKGCLRIRRTRARARLRVHGHAGLRSGCGNRAGGGRRERDRVHNGPRLGLRGQARALAQTRHQLRHFPAHARRHGHRLRRHPRRRLG
jgi:altronate hydrolase